jgi:hypothetical protein
MGRSVGKAQQHFLGGTKAALDRAIHITNPAISCSPPTINTDALATAFDVSWLSAAANFGPQPAGEQASRFEHDLQAIILLVQEHLVAPGRILEGQSVSDDKTRIDIAVLNFIE